MGSSMLDEDLTPVDVHVDDTVIRVRFSGGLELSTPVEPYRRLREASPSQRARWQPTPLGIHWPDVDEDLSVKGLFRTARRMPEARMDQIPVLISDLLKTTNRLNELFPGRPFTPDGHLVGSIGEVVAEYVYDLKLTPCSTPQIDAYTNDGGKSVQVKLTGQNGDRFAVRWPVAEGTILPDILLCLKLTVDGFIEIYNGPFPIELLRGKSSSNGQVSINLKTLASINPGLLQPKRSLDSVNRWFKSTPELAEVA